MEKSVAKKKRVGWLDYGKGILILLGDASSHDWLSI